MSDSKRTPGKAHVVGGVLRSSRDLSIASLCYGSRIGCSQHISIDERMANEHYLETAWNEYEATRSALEAFVALDFFPHSADSDHTACDVCNALRNAEALLKVTP